MNSASLLALIVDQHSGELPPEVNELLGAYLAADASARAEAERIRATLALTQQAILRHPELARVRPADAPSLPASGAKRPAPAWLARAAAIILFAALTGAGGYFAGRKHSAPPAVPTVVSEETARPPRKDSPWARYRFASDRPGRGLQIVRLDSAKATEGTLQ